MSSEHLFPHCRAVPRDGIAATGSFTTLQARINLRDDVANAATHKLLADWKVFVGDGNEQEANSSLCELGNWCSLVFPDSSPDRLAILTYLTDMGLIHDDTSEEMKLEDAVEEHNDFGAALDTNDTRVLKKGSKSDKLKKLVAGFLVNAMNIDHAKGAIMVDAYRNKWLAIMDKTHPEEFVSLDAYLAFRRNNGGMDPFWAMARFGMDLSLSDEELRSVEQIFQAADYALVLTNDYYSWDREYAVAKRTGSGRIVNAVELFKRTRNLLAEGAKEVTKQHILAHENQYVDRKTAFYQRHPDVSESLRRWIEVAGIIIAGNHYWCTRCPRHHVYDASGPIENRTVASEAKSIPSTSGSRTSSASTASEAGSVTSDTSVDSTAAPMLDSARSVHDKQSHDATYPETNMYKWPPVDTSILSGPSKYVQGMPSKGIRKSLIDALNDWFHVPEPSLKIIEGIVQLLHDASLILDDIEDCSPLRRGKPAAHTIFGHSQSINSANYMFVQAVATSRQLQSAQAVDVLLENLERLYVGQSLDLDWKLTLSCPSEEDYLMMIDHKTGGMFRLLAGLLGAEAKCEWDISLERLLVLFGRFFQIRDDYMNLASEHYAGQKGFCEDLDEGKFSYPIVHCLQSSAQYRSQILSVFRERPTTMGGPEKPLSDECKYQVLECLKSAGSLEATLARVNLLEDTLEAEISRIEAESDEENPLLRLLLKRLSLQSNSKHKSAPSTTFETFSLPDSNHRILGAPHASGTVSPVAFRPSSESGRSNLDSGIEAIRAMQAQDQSLTRMLATHGTLLFRDLPIYDSNDFSRFASAFGFKIHELIGNVKGGGELAPSVSYANEAPPPVRIYSHNESAHVPNAPGYVMFYGHRVPPSGAGGESPVSSSLELFHRANQEMPEFIAELAAKGVLSKVTYKTDQQYPGGSTLLEAFGKDVLSTDSKAERRSKMEAQIARYNRGPHTTWSWTDDLSIDGEGKETLTLTHLLPGIRTQAGTGHPSMFTGLAAYWKNLELRMAMDNSLANKRGGQMQQLYGDGTPIPDAYMKKLASITDELRVLHEWKRGDILVFDNTIAQHGRQPWVGEQGDRVIMASLWDGEMPGAYGDADWAQVVQPLA